MIKTIKEIHAFDRDDRPDVVAFKIYMADWINSKVGGWENVCLRLIRAFDSVGSRIHDRHVFFIPRKKKMTSLVQRTDSGMVYQVRTKTTSDAQQGVLFQPF